MRLRTLAGVCYYSARATLWYAIGGGAAIGFLLLVKADATRFLDDGTLLLHVRGAAIALVLGSAFVLDDAVRETVESCPTPLYRRRLMRLLPALAVLSSLWASILLYANAMGSVPAWPLTLEAAGMFVFVLAIGAAASPLAPDGLGGVAGGPLLLLLVGTSPLLPAKWTLFAASVTDSQWGPSHQRWWGIALVSIAILAYASADPARRTGAARVRARILRASPVSR